MLKCIQDHKNQGVIIMSGKKIIGLIILIAGLIILTISVTADFIGIGSNVYVFGYKQISGTFVGIIITLIGSLLMFKKQKKEV